MDENEEPFIAPLGLSVPSDVELVCVLVHKPLHCGLLLFFVVRESTVKHSRYLGTLCCKIICKVKKKAQPTYL